MVEVSGLLGCDIVSLGYWFVVLESDLNIPDVRQC
jgi:hypothetical protein